MIGYVAVRKNLECGHEFMLSNEISHTKELASEKAKINNTVMPEYAQAHPVVRVATVEIKEVSNEVSNLW